MDNNMYLHHLLEQKQKLSQQLILLQEVQFRLKKQKEDVLQHLFDLKNKEQEQNHFRKMIKKI